MPVTIYNFEVELADNDRGQLHNKLCNTKSQRFQTASKASEWVIAHADDQPGRSEHPPKSACSRLLHGIETAARPIVRIDG